MEKQWQLVMGIENDKVHFQVVSLDGKEIFHNHQATIKEKEFNHVKKVLNHMAPNKKTLKEEGFILNSDEIFLYIRDGARIDNDGEVACNRIGAINSKLPLLILSYFQNGYRQNKK